MSVPRWASRNPGVWGILVAIALARQAMPGVLPVASFAAADAPVLEREIAESFPGLAPISSDRPAFRRASMQVGGLHIAGYEAQGTRALRQVLADEFAAPFAVELGSQRVALRAAGARPSPALVEGGRVTYPSPWPDVDILNAASEDRPETLLLLRSPAAPDAFRWDILATEGVSEVTLHEGGVRFLARRAAGSWQERVLEIARPRVIDADGREVPSSWDIVRRGGTELQVALHVQTAGAHYPLLVVPGFCTSGSLVSGRVGHTATLLNDGRVLIAGGYSDAGRTVRMASGEILDPATGLSTAVPAMSYARAEHTATLLQSGSVLIVGGTAEGAAAPKMVELFNVYLNRFQQVSQFPAIARSRHTATRLRDGRVLLVGGVDAATGTVTQSAEIFDPLHNTFTAASGLLSATRQRHTATLLRSGKVLLAGGDDGNSVRASAELFDPSTGLFSALAASLAAARTRHTASLLPDGSVALAGGVGASPLAAVERYDPTASTFSTVGSLVQARYDHTATVLPDGTVLFTGGESGSGAISSAELYLPLIGSFASGGAFTAGRAAQTATLLHSGRVLLTGGAAGAGPLSSTELFEPSLGLVTSAAPLWNPRRDHVAIGLPWGKVLIAGGWNPALRFTYNSLEIGSGSGTFSTVNTPMSSPRRSFTATLIGATSNVLLAGGSDGTAPTPTTDIFDSYQNTLAAGPWMLAARQAHAAATLPNGQVIVCGGADAAASALASCELYEPSFNAFFAAASMTAARSDLTATALTSGRVLLAGGWNGAPVATADLFDPVSHAVTATGALIEARTRFTSSRLANGKVLVVGGVGAGGSVLASAELYDPISGTFQATGSLSAARQGHAAVVLASGKVLIAGGANDAAGLSPRNDCEIYDPATGSFQVVPTTMAVGRVSATATPLENGLVLIAGGTDDWSWSGQFYDPGPTVDSARRPAPWAFGIWGLSSESNMWIGGSGFVGDTEASSGGTNSSATNHPVIQLQRIDGVGGPMVLSPVWWRNPDFSESEYWFMLPAGLPVTWYRETLFVNGIPSAASGSAGAGCYEQHRPVIVRTAGTDPSAPGDPVTLDAGGAAWPHTAAWLWSTGETTRTITVSPTANTTYGVVIYNDGPAGCGGPVGTYTQTVLPAYGSTSARAGRSCRDILNSVPTAPSGVYWINPLGGSNAFQAYCDMTTDGGGWTLGVNSVLGSEASSADLTSNTGTPGLGTAHTRDLSELAVTRDAEIRHRIDATNLGSALFDAKYSGRYHDPLSDFASFTTLPGHVPGSESLLARDLGRSWGSACGANGSSWYLAASAPCYSSIPADLSDGANQGPPTPQGVARSYSVFVRERSLPPDDVQSVSVTSTDGTNTIEWSTPSVFGPSYSVDIRWKAGARPTGPTDGASLGPQGGLPATHYRLTHSGLVNGTTYYYAAFVSTGGASVARSRGRYVSGRPQSVSGSVKWVFNTTASSLAPPGIGMPALFSVSNDRSIYAAMEGTAGGSWPDGWIPFQTNAPTQHRPGIIPITIGTHTSVLYIGSQDGYVSCVDANTGEQVWRTKLPDATMVQAAPMGMFRAFGGAHDVVLVGTRNGSGPNAFYGLKPGDGTILWRFDNGGGANGIGIISSGAAVDYDNSRVIFTSRALAGGSANTVWCLDFTETGATLRWAKAHGDSDAGPGIYNGKVYVGFNNSTVYWFDAGSGAQNIVYGITANGSGPIKGFVAVDWNTGRTYVTNDNYLQNFVDQGTSPWFGWSRAMTAPSIPLFMGNALYVGSGDGRLYEFTNLTASSPTVKSIQLGDGTASVGAPSADDSMLYVGTEAGAIYGVAIPFP